MDSNILWCEDCRRSLPGDCPLHGPLRHIEDASIPPRSILTAPCQVSVRTATVTADGDPIVGVFASVNLQPRTSFGPVKANVVIVPPPVGENRLLLKCFRSGIDVGYYDVLNERNSNWLIYVRPALTGRQINVIVYLQGDDIFFCTAKAISADEELRAWYASDLVDLMGLPHIPEGDVASIPSTAVSVIRPTSRGAKRMRDRNGSTEAASPRSPQETLSHPGGSSSDSSPESRVNRRKCHKPQRVPQDFDNGESPADSVQESSRDTEDPHSSRNDTNESNHADEADDVEIVAEMAPISVQPTMPVPSPFDFPLFNSIFFPTAQRLVEQQQRLGLPLSPLTPFYFLPRINPAQFDVSSAPEDLSAQDISSRSPQSSSVESETESTPRGTCYECGQKFPDKAALMEHAATHVGGRPYICSYPTCDKFFTSKYKLLRHELIHSHEKRHHCPLCFKKFHRKDHLNNHLKVHEKSKVRLECQLCGCVFAKKWTYEKHLALHERDQDSTNASDNNSHNRKFSMDSQTNSMPSSEEEQRDSKRESNWSEYVQEYREDTPEPLSLKMAVDRDNCGDSDGEVRREIEAPQSSSSIVTNAHQNGYDDGNNGNNGNGTHTLAHKKQHANQKPSHPCEVCGKVFSASKDLRRHMQTHLGIKPNLCPYCPKKFTRKDHVRRHVQTVHSEECRKNPAYASPRQLQLLARNGELEEPVNRPEDLSMNLTVKRESDF
ncbi:hypothetical protein RvY_14287 [Ramazzottius varieornatus]|uniref:C2H2-type domain-containing protein n=1 Tax=Ramazzottius varieornatus TaxID=947166 RepID=A0A1D1VUN4_RAMVA|nr:hypothetical protein RvY_14287 [Ramazzottius varieornatus]